MCISGVHDPDISFFPAKKKKKKEEEIALDQKKSRYKESRRVKQTNDHSICC